MSLYDSRKKHAMNPNLCSKGKLQKWLTIKILSSFFNSDIQKLLPFLCPGRIFNHTLNHKHFHFWLKYKKKVYLERGCGEFYLSGIQKNSELFIFYKQPCTLAAIYNDIIWNRGFSKNGRNPTIRNLGFCPLLLSLW